MCKLCDTFGCEGKEHSYGDDCLLEPPDHNFLVLWNSPSEIAVTYAVDPDYCDSEEHLELQKNEASAYRTYLLEDRRLKLRYDTYLKVKKVYLGYWAYVLVIVYNALNPKAAGFALEFADALPTTFQPA